MKYVCDHAKSGCPKDCGRHWRKHDIDDSCTRECFDRPKSKCIPYVDPILKRVQERFNAEVWERAMEDGTWVTAILDRIIKEEIAK